MANLLGDSLKSLARVGLAGQDYTLVEQQLGAPSTLFNFGDQRNHGKVTATTGAGMRFAGQGLAPTWTYRVTASATAPFSWATAFDLANINTWQGLHPKLTFNGSTTNIDTPDAAWWTVLAATGEGASWGCWVNFAVVNAAMDILSKYDITTGAEVREWRLGLTSAGKVFVEVYDETANAYIGRSYNTALTAGQWYHIVATYAPGGTANASCKVYVNGAAVDDTDNGAGVFVSMQDTAALVRVGCSMGAAARTGFLNGVLLGGAAGPFAVRRELTSFEIANLYNRQRLHAGV